MRVNLINMKYKSNTLTTLGVTALLASASISYAQTALTPLEVTFGGNTKYDGWYNLSSSLKEDVEVHGALYDFPGNSGYGSFPGYGAWPQAIGSQLNSNPGSAAALSKLANGSGGGAYPSGGSMYFGGFSGDQNVDGGTLGVLDSSPVLDVQTIIFQIEIGEAFAYDYFVDGLGVEQVPSLTISYGVGEEVTLNADISTLIDSLLTDTIEMPTGEGGTMEEVDIYTNLYGYQWDVSGYSDIVDFSVSFTAVQHAQLYSLQLDQSDIAYGTT